MRGTRWKEYLAVQQGQSSALYRELEVGSNSIHTGRNFCQRVPVGDSRIMEQLGTDDPSLCAGLEWTVETQWGITMKPELSDPRHGDDDIGGEIAYWRQ